MLLYGCTTWTLTKRMEKKLDGNYTRMHKSWRQHPTKQHLYGHWPRITKTIQIRWNRYADHCWRSKEKLISDILLWTPSRGRPARTYWQQLCADIGCSLDDLRGAMDDSNGWQKSVREIRVSRVTWWWWWLKTIYLHINYYYLIKKKAWNYITVRKFFFIWQ